MDAIPLIETARLRLTALEERHFDAYAAMLGDPDSTRWVGDGQSLDRINAWRSMAMLLGHWQLRGYGMWALETRDDGRFVGRAPRAISLIRPGNFASEQLAKRLGGELVDTIDFGGAPAQVFAYHPPHA